MWEWWGKGNPPSGRGRLWCAPHCDNQSLVKVSAVWHTCQTSWWWQRKSYICSARQVFSDLSTQKPFFQQHLSFELTFGTPPGSIFWLNPFGNGYMKVVCAREDRAYASHWLGITAEYGMNGPWTMFVGLLATGGLSFFTDESRYCLDFTDKHARV